MGPPLTVVPLLLSFLGSCVVLLLRPPNSLGSQSPFRLLFLLTVIRFPRRSWHSLVVYARDVDALGADSLVKVTLQIKAPSLPGRNAFGEREKVDRSGLGRCSRKLPLSCSAARVMTHLKSPATCAAPGTPRYRSTRYPASVSSLSRFASSSSRPSWLLSSSSTERPAP